MFRDKEVEEKGEGDQGSSKLSKQLGMGNITLDKFLYCTPWRVSYWTWLFLARLLKINHFP